MKPSVNSPGQSWKANGSASPSDLHDLLGHTLSLIVVKSGGGTQAHTDRPAAGRREAADIERDRPHALAEVREAVTGYRGHNCQP